MNFESKPLQVFVKELISNNPCKQNFNTEITFPFTWGYLKVVTQITTTVLAADCILYGAVEATNENKEFGLINYWCFAGSGQGDRWFK